jgi:tetratricopeptide (TPR) repeat protein
VHLFHCEFEQMRTALEHGLAAGQGAGREERARLLHALGLAATLGPTPVEEARMLCVELREAIDSHPVYAALLQLYGAYLEALDGRFEEARVQADASRGPMEEFGRRILLGSQRRFSGQIELLAGDAIRAEALLRDGYRTLRDLGERGNAASVAAFLARALHALGRDEEAEAMAGEALALGSPEDVEMHVYAGLVRTRVCLAAGDVDEAISMARQAVGIAEGTDASTMRGDALLELARALGVVGGENDAGHALRALELYEAKGNRIGAGAAREFLMASGVDVH